MAYVSRSSDHPGLLLKTDQYPYAHQFLFVPLMAETTSDIEERYFYHSFPRRGCDTPIEIEKGCAILSQIRDLGFLLTPEILKWQHSHADGSPPRIEKMVQTRVCFTDLAPQELIHHASKFGHFSLEFEAQTIRMLGGLPVFYIPQANENALVTLEGLGSILVIQLLDALSTMRRIATLTTALKGPHTPTLDFNLRFIGDGTITNQFKLDSEATKNTLNALNHGLTPPELLANSLNALLAFFYPADDLSHDETLAYYRQREWRITGNMALRGNTLMRALTKPETQIIKQIDVDYFSRILDGPDGMTGLLDKSIVYPELNGRKLIEYARRVVVPSAALERVQGILSPLSRPPAVISLEEIAGQTLERKHRKNRENDGQHHLKPMISNTGNWHSRAPLWANIISSITCIGVLIAAAIYYGQLKAMQESTDASTKAANAADKAANTAEAALRVNIESSHRDQRAWVGISFIKLSPMQIGQTIFAQMKLTNSGKSFALNFRTTNLLVLSRAPVDNVEETEKTNPAYQTVAGVGSISPNGDVFLPFDSKGVLLTEDMIKDVNSGQLLIYLMGEVYYDDIFKKHHVTRFFQLYLPKVDSFETQRTHNDAD